MIYYELALKAPNILNDGDKQSGVSCGSLPAAYRLRWVRRHLHTRDHNKGDQNKP